MRWMVVACLALAGCVIPDTVEIDASGVADGIDIRTIDCGASTTIQRYAAGGGGLDIAVLDGAGHVVYAGNVPVGEVDDMQDIDGDAGTWTLRVKGEGFAGQFKISLQCATL